MKSSDLSDFFSRITGFSTPLGGISWVGSKPEKKIVYKLLQQLGDRRLIRNYHGAYNYREVIESLDIMRNNITSTLIELESHCPCRQLLENIRETLHIFQTFVENNRDPNNEFESVWSANEWFTPAAQEMRKVVASNLKEIGRIYSIELPDSLANDFAN